MDGTCRAIRIDSRNYRIEDQGVRFFLLLGTEKALLVDSGMTAADARKIAEEITDLPISLVNTHADPDHIAGNDGFDVFFMHPAESVNYFNAQKRNGRFIPVEEGYGFDLGERLIRVISIPGHTPGSIALLDEAAYAYIRRHSAGRERIHVRAYAGVPGLHP